MSTVDKRITITAFAGGAHFNQTFGTGRGVRNDLRIHRTASALPNSEIGRLLRPGERFALNAINARQWRAVLVQLRNKFRRIFLQAHNHTVTVVTHVAMQL